MRIVHFSDWHNDYRRLPTADLYVCTGDMYEDYWTQVGVWDFRPDPKCPQAQQRDASRANFRQYLGSPDAPIVCVRGNHDRTDLAHLFAGCDLRHEFFDDEIAYVAGLVITGHRGVPYINGQFSDEDSRADLLDRVRRMPAADLYLTHYPPGDVGLDGVDGAHYGLGGMAGILTHREGHQLHCFGHVHERGGYHRRLADTCYSNAATTVIVWEGSSSEGWSRREYSEPDRG